MSILKLNDKYGKTRLEDACQLALEHISKPGYKNIKMILESNQDIKHKEDKKIKCDSSSAFVRGANYYGEKNHEATDDGSKIQRTKRRSFYFSIIL